MPSDLESIRKRIERKMGGVFSGIVLKLLSSELPIGAGALKQKQLLPLDIALATMIKEEHDPKDEPGNYGLQQRDTELVISHGFLEYFGWTDKGEPIANQGTTVQHVDTTPEHARAVHYDSHNLPKKATKKR